MDEEKFENVNSLLNKTKGLILSNKNYNKFMRKYLILTQQSSFKLPEISNYPILKNGSMIPINRTTFTSKNDKNVIFSNLNDNNISNKTNKKDNKKIKKFEFPKFSENGINDSSNKNGGHSTKNIDINDNYNSDSQKINENNNNNNEIDNDENNYFSKNFYILRDKKLLDETEKNLRNVVNKISDLKLNSNNSLFLNKSDGTFKLKNSKFSGNNEIDNLLEYTKNYYLTKNYKTLMLSLLCDFQFCIKIFDYEKLVKDNFDENSNCFNEKKQSEVNEILLKLIERITDNSYENLTYELKKSYEVLDGKKLDLKISSILL